MEAETIETYCFKCPYCAEFAEPADLRGHDLYEENFPCDSCGKTFIATSYTSTTYTAIPIELWKNLI